MAETESSQVVAQVDVREVATIPGDNLLFEQNNVLDQEVKTRIAQRLIEARERQLPSATDYTLIRLHRAIDETLSWAGYDPESVAVAVPAQRSVITQNTDLAFNTLETAKRSGKGPQVVSHELASFVKELNLISDVKVAGPYVNIELDYREMAPKIISEVTAMGSDYGFSRDGDPQLVIIDYSSPNVAKNMTVAHLRSTIIGQSLMKIQAATGNATFGINHIGDWGTQFGNIIYQYRKELAERGQDFLDEMSADPTATLMRIYRQFTEDKKTHPESAQAAADLFLALESGDPELLQLWNQFRSWSLRDFGPTYGQLRIEFDAIQGESFYEDRMNAAVEEGLDQGVLVRNSEGAVVFPSQPLTHPTTGTVNDKAMFDQNGNERDEIIVKPSGGTVYLTRDLAAIRYRARELGADKILYVIGKEQQTHCLELFNMAHQLGYIALGGAEHISFGHLNINGRKMKSRSGEVVLLKDLLEDSASAAADLISERGGESNEAITAMSDDEKLDIARKVGVGSLIFNDLKQDRAKDIEFSPDAAKTLKAGGAAYIQYTDARINGILDKAGENDTPFFEVPEVISRSEQRVLLDIAQLPLVIKEAAKFNSPHKIATFLTTLCQDINVFYRDNPVNNASDPKERSFRLHLIKAAQQVMANAADLLHFELPGRM